MGNLKKILIAEDDELTADALIGTLKILEIDSTYAKNREESMKIVKSDKLSEYSAIYSI
ncbi:MAG: hypothetical protein KAK00_06915 [Nanoarchaeota archaeon]|nr:hypothetical protein [Nanoarchaeota archaeon]